MPRRFVLLLSVVLAFAPVASAQGALGELVPTAPGIASVNIAGNTVTAVVDLGSGLAADLTLDFEDASNLTVANLGLSATLVDPLDLAPRLDGVSLASGFPVLIQVAPPTAGGLAFHGVYALSLHTHALTFTVECPLRLYTAEAGGTFHDMTETIGTGSYRARGTGGTFSDFLIVADLRPAAVAVEEKFDAVEDLLATYDEVLPDDVSDDLAGRLASAREAWDAGDPATAAQRVDGFALAVKAASGSSIPDLWRSARDTANVAGMLRSAASTLRFSLNLAAG